jgi:hypothetical protein
VDVEEKHVDVLRREHPLDLLGARRLEDAVALELEVHATEQPKPVVVVRDEDRAVAAGGHPARVYPRYDRALMERAVRPGERRAYASAVADLWERLGRALARLERVAEAPADRIALEAGDELPVLQYSLHAASELAVGIRPPAGAEAVHEELVAALDQARDATADVGGALDEGDDELVERLLPEWRGALFRVRLARLRALERSPLQLPDADGRERRPIERGEPALSGTAIAATVLVVAGALLFTAGAVLAAWPVWAAGLALFGGGFVLFRP